MRRIVPTHPILAARALSRLVLAVLAVGSLLLSVTVAQAQTPEQRCQATKNRIVGKYTACRQNAEAKFATLGDGGKHSEALTRCGSKFTSAWLRATANAAEAGATCLDASLTESDFQTILDASTDNIADALAGLGLTDCSADLATCAGDLGTCTGDLGMCTTDLAQAATDLGTCNGTVTALTGDLTTCNGNLGTCTTSLATANGSLSTCNGNLSTCDGSLNTCNGSLGTCTGTLNTCNANLGTCNGTVTTLSANLTTCNGGLTTCNGSLGTCNASLGTCTTDLATAQRCGNAMIDPGEDCDFGTLNGETCMTQGFGGGSLACGAGCEFDTAGCSMVTPTPTPIPTPFCMPFSCGKYTDNCDGTVSDPATGLMWEKKTTIIGSGKNYTDPHDVDNDYTWSAGASWNQDGTAFTDFLAKLNDVAGGGTNCFAGHCDWRLPEESGCNSCYSGNPTYKCTSCGTHELETLLIGPYLCGSSPCIDPIFGPTVATLYWSATSHSQYPDSAWLVDFSNGRVYFQGKSNNRWVRAVRTSP